MQLTDILGQEKALKLLDKAFSSGRLAHGYFFSGPSGVGKATTALAIAALMLCEQRTGRVACGTCRGCRQFYSGNHPDFLHIQPDGAAIKIDQVRSLKKALSFSPFSGGKRVVILEDVQTLRREAGNSLLKLLEEPPPDNLLILIGTADEAMLPTLISRCQVIPFLPLSLPEAIRVIQRNISDIALEDAATLAALAGGCPGQALEVQDSGVLAVFRFFVDLSLEKMAGEAGRVNAALLLAARMGELKTGLDALFNLLRIFFRDILLIKKCPSRSSFCLPEALRATQRWNLQELSDNVEAVNFAEQALARNCNKALVCEVLLLNLLQGGSQLLKGAGRVS